MFDAQYLFLGLGARTLFNQIMERVCLWHQRIHQVTAERIGRCSQALQGNAVLGLGLLQLDRELAACLERACNFSGRNACCLADGTKPAFLRAWSLSDRAKRL